MGSGYKGGSGGSWLSREKQMPPVPPPMLIFASALGFFVGVLFKATVAQYLFITLSLIFATVADLLISTVLVIGVSLFMIYSLKKSTVLRIFLIWLLIGILIAAVIALPFVQQYLGEGYELLKNSVILLGLVIVVIASVFYYMATTRAIVKKSDVHGYSVARKKYEKGGG